MVVLVSSMEEGDDVALRPLNQPQAIIRANRPELYDPKSDICYLLFAICHLIRA
jgi:hypothetical protein